MRTKKQLRMPLLLLTVVLVSMLVLTVPAALGAKEKEPPLKFTFTMSSGLNSYILKQPDINQDKWVKEMKSRYNVDMTIKLLDHRRLIQEYQILYASGDIPDVVRCYDNYTRPEMAQSVENNVFMPLDDLLKKNKSKLKHLLKTIPEGAWQESYYNGKMYGIPNIYLSRPQRRATYIRKDLLDKLKLKPPTNLQQTLAVLRAFKKAGVPYPYAGREKWAYTDIFFGAFGVSFNTWNLNKEGQLVPDMIRPEMKEALKFQAMLRQEGLMDPESLTTTSNDWLNKIYAGKVGMFDHNSGQLSAFNSSTQKNVPEAKWILIPSPTGPGGDKGMYRYSQVFETTYINKNFKEPLRFLQFLDRMCQSDAQEFAYLGILGTDYQKENGKIIFKYPTEQVAMDEMSFRKSLIFIRDDSFDNYTFPFRPTYKEETEWLTKVAPKEGYSWIEPAGQFKALVEHPELKPNNCDLFWEYSARIFYGQGDADQLFDEFVKEYLKRGGDEIVKGATEMYKAGKVWKR